MGWKRYLLVYDPLYSIEEWKFDDIAFIFTLKNPHGVEPSQYMKREESNNAIDRHRNCGPSFGSDIQVINKCNKCCCYIHNNGKNGYECHPQYMQSLYANTAEPSFTNFFSVLDYEVYTQL